MEPKKQKQQKNHVVIVTSDAADASVKQFRIQHWVMWVIIIGLCILIGTGLGYIMYEDQIWSSANERIEGYKVMTDQLEKQLKTQQEYTEEAAKEYQAKIDELEKQCGILSDTVNLKDAEIVQMTQQLDKLYNPTLLPLTGRASIVEKNDEEPMCLFEATEGALVIATASGTVTELVEEAEYGYKVSVDHGNGYVTIYCNKEIPRVKQGDVIMQGTTLFVIGKESLQLRYQIIKDGTYIKPMDMMEIEG